MCTTLIESEIRIESANAILIVQIQKISFKRHTHSLVISYQLADERYNPKLETHLELKKRENIKYWIKEMGQKSLIDKKALPSRKDRPNQNATNSGNFSIFC